MNSIYTKHFTAPDPARTTIALAALPPGATVEIDVIAAAEGSSAAAQLYDVISVRRRQFAGIEAIVPCEPPQGPLWVEYCRLPTTAATAGFWRISPIARRRANFSTGW